jgi:hypothetical protein
MFAALRVIHTYDYVCYFNNLQLRTISKDVLGIDEGYSGPLDLLNGFLIRSINLPI